MSSEEWRLPPEKLDLPGGALDVWRAELTGRDHARTIVKRLLARYLGVAADAVEIEVGPHGKPALAGRSGALHFNMSHTRGLGLFAFARGGEVGVDLERPGRTTIDMVRIARRFLGLEETERLAALAESEREAVFLQAWVRYEARVKCLGTGIGADAGAGAHGHPAPWIADLDPGYGMAGAVAAAERPRLMRCWQWIESVPADQP